MEPIVFRYRSRELTSGDIEFIRSTIAEHYIRGRAHISKVLCRAWEWAQPNGKLKECAARDLLLRLEEAGYIELPRRLRPSNNTSKSFKQIPLFKKEHLTGSIGEYTDLDIRLIDREEAYLWGYLLQYYHYLGFPRLVGENLRYAACINGQVVACLAWASAAWKVRSRDEFICWDEETKRKNLHLIANNTRFLILPWVKVRHLASKILALNLKRLGDDWQKSFNHRVYLAESFVDQSRFQGTCYKASNWHYVGQTSGSAKRGNQYRYHGNQKAVYLYPLDRNFRRLLNNKG
jgi:hypothetical protein